MKDDHYLTGTGFDGRNVFITCEVLLKKLIF